MAYATMLHMSDISKIMNYPAPEAGRTVGSMNFVVRIVRDETDWTYRRKGENQMVGFGLTDWIDYFHR